MADPLILLLAEDQMLIGMDLQFDLEEFGFIVAGPFLSSLAALDYMTQMSPDIALLDNLLQDGPCCDVGLELHRRGIPFVVYSGQQRRFADDRWNSIPDLIWIDKPARFDTVLASLRGLILVKAYDAN